MMKVEGDEVRHCRRISCKGSETSIRLLTGCSALRRSALEVQDVYRVRPEHGRRPVSTHCLIRRNPESSLCAAGFRVPARH